MKVRTLVVALVAAASLALAGVAGADPGDNGPGPNGHNDYGLCKAYSSGSDNGKEHKRNAPPFQALEEAADDGDDSTSPEEDVAAFCENVTPGGK